MSHSNSLKGINIGGKYFGQENIRTGSTAELTTAVGTTGVYRTGFTGGDGGLKDLPSLSPSSIS